jgi:hypothetical protein
VVHVFLYCIGMVRDENQRRDYLIADKASFRLVPGDMGNRHERAVIRIGPLALLVSLQPWGERLLYFHEIVSGHDGQMEFHLD